MPSTPLRTTQLRTSGGLTLTGVAADAQRYRSALLAPSAVARQNDMGRDRMVALLWPASDTDRAADSFRQILHTVRRELDDAALDAERPSSHPFRVYDSADSAVDDWLAIN